MTKKNHITEPTLHKTNDNTKNKKKVKAKN